MAADKPCTKADAANAEKAIDRVVAWPAMQKAVKDWGHCDTGQAAEYFTEALLRLLVGSWIKVSELEPLYYGDNAFREWIDKRLADPALPRDDADQVHDLSQNSCPKARKKLCDDLHKAVEDGKSAGMPAKPAPPAAPAAPAATPPPTAPAKAPETEKGKPAQ